MTDIFDSTAFVASNKLVIETVDLVKMYGPHVALEGLNLKLESGAIGIFGSQRCREIHIFQMYFGG